MGSIKIQLFFLWVLFHAILSMSPAHATIGFPLITNYSIDKLVEEQQVWSIVQDSRGTLFFATNDGVLKYDGINWEIYPTPLNSSVRSMDIDNKNVIYVGATREFGYFKPGTNGRYSYYSLSDSLTNKNFNAVLKTFCLHGAVYYAANHKRLFKYNHNKVKEIKTGLETFRLFKINNTLYLTDENAGIWMLRNDSLVAIYDKPLPGVIYSLEPLNKNEWLAATLKDGLFVYHTKNKVFTPFNTSINNQLQLANVYKTLKLKNNNIAISTLKHGVYVVSKEGELRYNINKTNGLNNNAAYFLFQDNMGDLWVGLERGITQLELSVPFTKFDNNAGLEGALQKVTLHNNKLYCGTSNGLFQLKHVDEKSWHGETFSPVTLDYIYNLNHIKVQVPGFSNSIFLASFLRDIIWVRPDHQLKEIYKIYGCYAMAASPKIKGRLFLGSPTGIEVISLYKHNNTLKARKINTIPQIEESIRQLLFTQQGDLWVRTAFNSIYKIEFNHSESLSDLRVHQFLNSQQFDDLVINGMYNFDNKIFVATNKGVFNTPLLHGNEVEKEFIPLEVFDTKNKMGPKSYLSMGKDGEGNYWFGLSSGIIKYITQNKTFSAGNFNRLNGQKIQEFYTLDSLGLALITDNNLYFINNTQPLGKTNFNTIINKVSFNNGNHIIYNDGNMQQELLVKPPIAFDNNAVSFDFTAPYYQQADKIMYQWKLDGFDSGYNNLSVQYRTAYTNLPGGKYTFKVKAVNIYNQTSKVGEVSFTIKNPWYKHPLAFVSYSLITIILIWAIIVLYTWNLKREKNQLEKAVKEAIQKEEDQKEEIESQADRLKQSNKELEKLSLVASKTDNAIIIMDAGGEITWINKGYTKMYGFTLDDLKKGDKKIIGENANISINQMVNVWYGAKQPIIFENLKKTKSGNKIWAQTTLTPILDGNGNLDKLIAIEADISKLKEAEKKIEKQSDEIVKQRDLALKQRDEITEQKREIVDSIEYAKRIQRAIFNDAQELKKIFPCSFVYMKPRDIVSGDFFWCHQLKNYNVIISADCTGHGVPGAFMSLLGVTFLNNIVKENGVIAPDEILNRLREHVIHSLGQKGEENEAKDGMDVSVCVVDRKTNELHFAGANNPAYVIRQNQLHELEADKMPISIYHSHTRPFSSKLFHLKSNDTLYMFSDGFADQFGGDEGKKYKIKRFKQFLMEVSQGDFKDQQKIIDKEHISWKGNHDQVDDILVIGIKI